MNWTETTGFAFLEGKSSATSVVDDGKIYVIGRNDGSNNPTNEVWVSVDGITWNMLAISSGFEKRYGHSSVVYDGKIWVIGGYSSENTNNAWTSADGVIWNKEIDDISDLNLRYHSSFVLNSKIWIIGGQKITSSDMTNEVWSIE